MSSIKYDATANRGQLFGIQYFFILLLILFSQTSMAFMPDPYDEPGLNPFRDNNTQQEYENVDPFTGKLQLNHTDIFIPGNGGLDLKVIRSYSNRNLASTGWSDAWSTHFGYVERSGDTSIANICANNFVSNKTNPVLVLPDGSNQVLSDADTGAGYLFISKQHWKATCAISPASGLIVTSPEGTVYEMTYNASNSAGKLYYVSKITDKNGNWIVVNYATNTASGGARITSVSTSDGRALTYTYLTDTYGYTRLSTITDGSRTWTYTYTQVLSGGGQVVVGAYALTTVTRPDGLTWQYTYNTSAQSGVPTPAGYYSISSVKNPAGGTIGYTYDYKDFHPTGLGSVRSEVITSKTISGLGTWSYSYTPSTGFGMLDTTVVSEPLRTITYQHYGFNTVAFQGETWKIGLLKSKSIGGVQTESYTWSPLLLCQQNDARIFPYFNRLDTENYVPLLTSKAIVRDGAGFTTTYSGFDNYGNPSVVSESGSAGRTLLRSYYVNTSKWILHQLQSENNSGYTTTYGIDGNGNVISENKFGIVTGFGRTPSGDISSISDARGKVKTLSSYYRGIPQAEAYPDAAIISRAVSSLGTINSVTNGKGEVTGYSYDALNRLTFINKPIGNDSTINWGPTSRVVTRGNFQEITNYDGHYRATSKTKKDLTTGVLISTSFNNDALGRKTFESLPGSATGTAYIYDDLGRLLKATFANGTTNTYSYSGSNVVFTNERGLSYTYGYRIFGNPDNKELMSVAAPVASTNMTITRNAIGQPQSITQNGVTRSYVYSANGFLTSETNPETGVTTYGRDAVGNMTTKKVGTSAITTYTYDPMNRVSNITYPTSTLGISLFPPISAPSENFTYDLLGRVTTSTAGSLTRTNTYDANGNLTSETTSPSLYYSTGANITYTYNANDVLSQIKYPSGVIIPYTLDAFGRQTSASPYATSVSYHPSNQPSSITLANGVVTNYSYQARYWPSAMAVAKSTTPLLNSTYTYDNKGNLSNIADTVVPAYNRTLTFDGVDRVIGANGGWGTGTIAYNGQGNITSQQYGTYALTHNYDTQNRLSTVTGNKPYTFTYDLYGNATSNGTSYFQYDEASNLRRFLKSGLAGSTYEYDANHKLYNEIGDKDSGVQFQSPYYVQSHERGKTEYYYSSFGMLLETRSNKNVDNYKSYSPTPTSFFPNLGGSSTVSELQSYVYLGDKLLAQRAVKRTTFFSGRPTTTNYSAVTYYHNDVAGSPLAVTDAAGAVKWRENYWPYGERNARDPLAAGEKLWFAGKPQDADSGLSYFGARYYDPVLGRFMGIDPVGVNEGNIHSFNRYAYGNNNPYKFVDPDGRIAETVWDVANVLMDVASLGTNVAAGNYGAAAVDGVGLIIDGAATAVPFIPGGAGASIKAYRAADNVVDSAKATKKVHGNSLDSTKPAEGYSLRDRDTGEIKKYGETTRGEKRYSKKYLEENNARMKFEASGSKREMHDWQHEKILDHKVNNGGARPGMNKSDY